MKTPSQQISTIFEELQKHAEDSPHPAEPELYISVDENASQEEESPLIKSVLNYMHQSQSMTRLAFEMDPDKKSEYQSLYYPKTAGIPDMVLKKIGVADDLVATILSVRSDHISAFGHPRKDRFSSGYTLEPKPGIIAELSDPKVQQALTKRVDSVVHRLKSCGESEGWERHDRCSFSQWLRLTVRDSLLVGRFATELLYVNDGGQKKFHSFRAIDAATIYRAVPRSEQGDSIRAQAFQLLQRLKNEKLSPERYQNNDYAWFQVTDGGTPKQAFTSDECLVENMFDVTDIEWNGYPITPIDTTYQAITTHMNITTHNRLYFQSGRASRGIVVIQSESITQKTIDKLRQEFQARINSVQNSHRVPVVGLRQQDSLNWVQLDTSNREAEFMGMSDANCRVILAAFRISPDEVPGYSHLSRGTNTQALSESDNEFKLEAARDVGIRPLLQRFENFINDNILPLIDPLVAKHYNFRFMGLDATTPEKENVLIQQWQLIYGDMNSVLRQVERAPIAREMGGNFPFSTAYQAVLDKYFTVGQILEYFMGIEGASKDPKLAYVRDQYWMNWQQMLQAQAAQQQQAAMAQQQSQEQQQPGGEHQPLSDDQLRAIARLRAAGTKFEDIGAQLGLSAGQVQGVCNRNGFKVDASVAQANKQPADKEVGAAADQGEEATKRAGGQELEQALASAQGAIQKSEEDLPVERQSLARKHSRIVDSHVKQLLKDAEQASKDILAGIFSPPSED